MNVVVCVALWTREPSKGKDKIAFKFFPSHLSLSLSIPRRELVPKGTKGNLFRYFEDIPMFWDAWDVEIYHLEKGWDAKMGTVTIEESGPLRVVLKCQHRISPTSHLEQRIIVNCESPAIEFDTHVKWNENRKILKVEFPVNINCDYATYETQFGFVQRPTHSNTSWDMAKFEVCGHKFVDFSEYGYGVTMLNDW